MKVSGFFSYAHADDSFGMLSNFRDDLCVEFKRVSGSDLELFIDHESIKWGDKWQEAINTGIDSAAFFIPVLSPLYLQSPACQQEMRQYLGIVRDIDAEELFMPLLLTDIARGGLELDRDLLKEVLGYQYYDATELNSLDRGSGRYRQITREIATKLFDANMRISEKSRAAAAAGAWPATGENEDEVGDPAVESFLLDAMADFEPKMNELVRTIGVIGDDMRSLGGIAESKTPEFEKAGKGPNVAREMIAVASRLAEEMAPAADLFEQHAKDYQRQTNEIDLHVRRLSEVACQADAGNKEPGLFLDSLKEAAEASAETKRSLEGFKDQVSPLQRVSRVLYKPVRTVERATTLCLGALDVSIAWGDLALSECDSKEE